MTIKVGHKVRWRGIDGVIREGEILAFDDASVTVRDAADGLGSTVVPKGLLTEERPPAPEKRGLWGRQI